MMEQPETFMAKYLSRCALWNWYNNSFIVIMDENGAQKLVLDEWQTMIFYMADGMTSLNELIASLMSRREDGITEQEFIDRVVATANELITDHCFIRLLEVKGSNEDRFDTPLKEQ